ncbi:MAG TPA: M48 family metallopeptidase, partial [Verrucomicrobiae bacterium]|nr:M48 family metallopeptidase [Verrucomicrobiae bacterium]
MDFFAAQDTARKKTKWLVLYFTAAVVCIVTAIYLIVLFSSFTVSSHHRQFSDEPVPTFSWWDAKIFLGAAIGTLAVILGGCAYKMNELAGGGSAVAESLGGRLLATNTQDPDERKLLNVVEEMAIASGVPVPKVYVLDDEDYINAFAAGHSASDAVVAVTRNCMRKLSRDELQGVIGHEFSHILNGDMRLNLRLIGILFGIFCLATVGRIILQSGGGGSNRRGDGRIMIFGLLLLVVGSIGVFFGRLIQAAVSRQREYLADASSVQFTRNPLGLSGALQKVGGYGSRLWSPHAPDAGHLFFSNGIANSFLGLMATHPPLDERIRRIDSTWDGKYQRLPEDKTENLKLYRKVVQRELSPRPPMPNLFGTLVLGSAAAMDEAVPQRVKTPSVLPNLGNPTPLHLKYAEQLRDSMPDEVRAAAREPLGATALVYAILLSCDDEQRRQQLAELEKRVGADTSQKAGALFP